MATSSRVAALCALCLAISWPGACSSGGGEGGGSRTSDPGASQRVLALEDDAHDGVNLERLAQGRAALTHDATLRAVARAHSEDMIARGFFAHTNPDGDDPFDRMADAGHSYSTAGENIAYNLGFSDPAATAITGWMNSSGHRANILNAQFTHGGLGVAIDEDGRHYFTQVFSRPSGQLLLGSWIVDYEAEDESANFDGSAGASSTAVR